MSLSLHRRTDAQRQQTCLASTQALRSRRVSSALKSPDCVVAHWWDWCSAPIILVRCCRTSIFGSSVLALWINQRTQWFSGEPLETPRTRCSLRQSPLMTQLQRSPSSTLVFRLNQETIHDFILPFLPPCSPHLTPLATGSLEPSLLVFYTPGGLTGNDLSCLFFTCNNTNQAATCTCNTKPRISPHHIVNHSSHQEATIRRSSNHTWLSIPPLMSALATNTFGNQREKEKKRND
jgi:hypothetical protein